MVKESFSKILGLSGIDDKREQIKEINVASIKENPYQPRRIFDLANGRTGQIDQRIRFDSADCGKKEERRLSTGGGGKKIAGCALAGYG